MSTAVGYVARDFRLDEFAVSAAHPELVEPVPTLFVPRIARLASQGLQIVRDAIGRPMHILSGYRSLALNTAAGGEPTSQHMEGEAADFTCDDIRGAFETVIDLVAAGKLPIIGQIIFYPEKSFVHMALKSERFPVATCCINWPSHNLKYHAFEPTRAMFASLVPDPNGTRLA